ncbi:MAG TPA: TIGR04282 family arsenosugar biosynthesis glycosyltransferase [Stellaceae bacterium]|nr:TIGR04282 family arsenosugar biosynthesis glycosyltransferase [Stellaceae bacterium]
MQKHLILFARVPRLGDGKKRLARDIGVVAAVRFERAMIARLLRRLGGDRRWRLSLAVTPEREMPRARRWRHGAAVIPQGAGDLGRRMRRALSAPPPGPVVLVGADIPALEARHIAAAFRLLGRHDLVFGPAADGGFWLVGVRRRPRLPPLFAAVRWSTHYALADTIAGLPRGVSVGFVETLEDVDDGAAYRRLRNRLTL